MEPRDTGAVKASLSDQWRKYVAVQNPTATTVLIDLPSGMQVRATRPHLLLLLRTGKIPDALTHRVESMIATAGDAGEDGVKARIKQEQDANPAGFYAEWTNLLDVVWSEAVIEPRFTMHPKLNPDLIPLSAVDVDDKTYLFVWAQGVDESVQGYLFRRERESASLEHPSAGDRLPPGPGDVVGDRPTSG